jgi:type II secretory pathway pseudopilin PulG
MNIFKKNLPGFTLVELLLIITILAVIVAAAVVLINSSLSTKRDKQRKADLVTIGSSLETRLEQKGSLPDFVILKSNDPRWSDGTFIEREILPKVPKDPEDPNRFYIYKKIDSSSFEVWAKLDTPPKEGDVHFGSGPEGTNYVVTPVAK